MQVIEHSKHENMELQNTRSRLYTLRNTLLFMNILFTVGAGFLIAAGSEITRVYDTFGKFLGQYYKFPAQILIAQGLLLIFITCFGWFGTIKRHLFSLRLYFTLLLALAVFNIVITITYFMALKNIGSYIDLEMFESVKHFERDTDVRLLWNYIQKEYSCCGVYFPENWYGIKGDGINGGIVLQQRGFSIRFPYSCCSDRNCTTKAIFENGCANHIIYYATKATILIACISLALSIIQIISAMVAFSFVRHVQQGRNIKSLHKHLHGRFIIFRSSMDTKDKPEFV